MDIYYILSAAFTDFFIYLFSSGHEFHRIPLWTKFIFHWPNIWNQEQTIKNNLPGLQVSGAPLNQNNLLACFQKCGEISVWNWAKRNPAPSQN